MQRLAELQSLYLTKSGKDDNLDNPNSSISKLPPIVVVEAAVLLDANWDDKSTKGGDIFDGIWVVRASPEMAAKRLVERRGMDESDAKTRMEAQLSRRGIGNLKEEVRSGVVTAVIDNDGEDATLGGEDGYQGDDDDDGSSLVVNLRRALVDPACWKVGRCPDS